MRRIGVLAVALAVVVAITGLASAAPETDRRELTGAEIFRGVFFLDGPAVEQVPSLSRLAAGFAGNGRDRVLQAEIMERIERNRPGFIDWFSREVSSGDHLRVRGALDAGARAIEEAVYEGPSAGTLRFGSPEPDACSVGIFICVWTAGGAYNWLLAVNVAAAVLAWVWWAAPDGGESPRGRLAYDQLVADLVALNR